MGANRTSMDRSMTDVDALLRFVRDCANTPCLQGGPGNHPCPLEDSDDPNEYCLPHRARRLLAGEPVRSIAEDDLAENARLRALIDRVAHGEPVLPVREIPPAIAEMPMDAAARENEPKFMDPVELERIVNEVVSNPKFQEELERRLAPYKTPPLSPLEMLQPIKENVDAMRLSDVRGEPDASSHGGPRVGDVPVDVPGTATAGDEAFEWPTCPHPEDRLGTRGGLRRNERVCMTCGQIVTVK